MSYTFGSILDRQFRYGLNQLSKSVDIQGKTIQKLVADGQLTPSEYAQLVSIINGNIKKGELSIYDIDKNKGKFDETFFTDKVKQQWTGNAPVNAMPPDGGVTTEKMADKSVTRDKRTELGETGLVTGSKPVEVNFFDNSIKYSPSGITHFVMHRGVPYEIPANTTLKMTSRNGISGIWFDTQTEVLSEIRYTGEYASITEHHILLGYIYVNKSNTLNAEMFGNYMYIGDDTKRDAHGFIISNDKVDFDFNENAIKFPPRTHSYLFVNGQRYQIQNQTTVSFDHLANETMFKIMFSTTTGEVYVTEYSTQTNNLDMPLGAVITSSETVFFNGDFTVNGQNYILPGLGEVKYIGSDAVDINVDDRVVTFPNPTSLLYINGIEYRVQDDRKIIYLDDVYNIQKLVFNTATEDFRISTSNTMFNNDFVVMAIKLTDPVQVDFGGSYTINGAPVDGDSIVDHNLEDMIWSWWIYPLATRFKGMRDRTYIGYTDSKGYSGVGSLDNETGQRRKIRLKNDRIDDHNAAAVDVMDDGRIITAYSTGHNSDGNIHIRVSSEIESVEAFQAATTVSTDGRITYAHLFNGGGKWYLFFRGPEGDECSYTMSEDGINWSAAITLLDYNQVCYPKIQYTTDSDILRFVITTNPMSGEAHFRLAFFDMTTGELSTEDGTLLGSENVLKDNIPLIVERISGMTQRLLDVAVTDRNETIIGYSVFTQEADADDIDYRVAHWSNGELNIDILTSAGQPFFKTSNYVGGIAFGYNKNELYLSREDNDVWHIEKWTTTDKTSWVKAETIHTSQPGYVALRPILEKDGDKILWHEGKYNYDSYSDYYTDVKYRKIREI